LRNIITYHHDPKLLIISVNGYQVTINKNIKIKFEDVTEIFILQLVEFSKMIQYGIMTVKWETIGP